MASALPDSSGSQTETSLRIGLSLTSSLRKTFDVFRQAAYAGGGRTMALHEKLFIGKVVVKCRSEDCPFALTAETTELKRSGDYIITECSLEHSVACKQNAPDLTIETEDDDDIPGPCSDDEGYIGKDEDAKMDTSTVSIDMAEPASPPPTAPEITVRPPPYILSLLKVGRSLTMDARSVLLNFQQASFENLGRVTRLDGGFSDERVVVKCKTKNCTFALAAVKLQPVGQKANYCIYECVLQHTAFCQNNQVDLTLNEDNPFRQIETHDDPAAKLDSRPLDENYAKQMGFGSHEQLVKAQIWLKKLLSSCIDTFDADLADEFAYALNAYPDELAAVCEYIHNYLKSRCETSAGNPESSSTT